MSDKFTFRSAVHLMLIKDHKALLLRRFKTGWMDGHYSVIAGHVDGKETIAHAMIREAAEEGDIRLEEKDVHVAHTMHRTAADAEYIDFFLRADTWSGEPKIMEPDKCDDLSWHPLAQLPENTIPYIRFAFENIQAGIPFSEWHELQSI